MASKNAEAALRIHEAFNRQDLDALVAETSESITHTDHGRGATMKGREELRNWMAAWIGGFSDGQTTDQQVHDAGDTVIVQFIGQGTNDGPLGPLPATGRHASLDFCQIYRFGPDGLVDVWDTYYDMLSLLVQLGHAQPPPMA